MGYYNNVLTFTWKRDTDTSNCTVSRFHFYGFFCQEFCFWTADYADNNKERND